VTAIDSKGESAGALSARRPIDSGARVGIVGAGASGLAAAHELQELGYRRVTVLEREPCAGGKCCTIVHDDRTYELGAALVTPAYRRVRALMREVGVRAAIPPGGLFAPMRDVAAGLLLGEPSPRRLIGSAADGARFALELSRHRRIFSPGFGSLNEQLALPFDDWCRARHCEAMRSLVEPWVTGFGYGFLDELPAAYVLKYATLFGSPLREILDDGYGGLFRRVAASLDHVDVRLGTRVCAVVRGTNEVTVRTTDGTLVFDALIVACPLDEALSFLDATPTEVQLFERIRYQPYVVLGATVTGGMPRSRYLFLRENFRRESIGQPVFAYRRWPASDTVFFYAFASEPDWERAVRREVASAVEGMGGRLGNPIAARKWRYFPHVQTDDFASGYYRRLEALQGQRRTYYCGEVLAFAAVETVVAYARSLVRRHFSGARAPTDREARGEASARMLRRGSRSTRGAPGP
jgi:hypothetical protein